MELLRPPAHRGPLIASGAVVLATGVVLAQLRLEEPLGDGVHLLYAALAAAVMLALGLQARLEGGAPAAYQSVLLVTGLVLLGVALFRLADVLGAGDDGYPSGAVVWTSLLLGGAALACALRARSSICGFIAALAGASALLNLVDLLFHPDSATPYRVLLVGLAGIMVLVSLVLRGGRYRASVLLVDAAALFVAGVALTFVSVAAVFSGSLGEGAGAGWELVVLVAACGLIAFGAVDRQPGPAYLGVLNLVLFIVLAVQTDGGEDTLLWWPLLLLALGAGVMAAGLRPRRPLPPEPPAYGAQDLPLASRTADDESVVRVRVDD
ncbi:MAG: hypothetical protein M3P50_00310 [Actinomycetota bacterium]|nr:hypothetical protein [Actinomycetota bacterium]